MSAAPAAVAAETEEAKRQRAELAGKWLKEISRRRSNEKRWREQGKKVVNRYRDERDNDVADGIARFNILWANVEVLKPAIFARMPVPDVRRRYLTKDPIARTAAMILERALSYSMEQYDFRDVLDRCEEDYLLPGRGEAIVCYKPMFETVQVRKPVEPLPPGEDDDGDETDDLSGLRGTEDSQAPNAEQGGLSVVTGPNGDRYPPGTAFDAQGAFAMQAQEDKLYEEVLCDYVEWDLFVFGEGKTWSKVPWIATGERLTKDEAEEECPDFKDWEAVQFTDVATDSANESEATQEKPAHRCLFWRVWHKASRKYMIFAEGYKEGPLLIADDPLQLQSFYPCPEPLYALRNNKSWTPKPEFLQYQDQALELDRITNRLKNLIEACKNRGVYDQAMDALAKLGDLMKAADNTYTPIPNFAQLAEKGGLEALLSSLPLEQIVATIAQLRERGLELVQQIYEIMGISDIVRGSTSPSETLGAQQLKAQYAGMRISTRQERFQRFIRDILRIKAELIAEHFDEKTLMLMTGLMVIPDQVFAQLKQQQSIPAGAVSATEFTQACALIRSDKLRGFKIDIETDSTVPVDKDTEQKNRVEFIAAIGQYLQGVIPAVQEGAIPMKVAREGLLFVVRGFKVGTELEEVLEELGENEDDADQLQKMKQMLQQSQLQMQELQDQNGKLTQQNQQLQAKAETEAARVQAKAQTDQYAAEQKAATDQQAAQIEANIAAQKVASDAQVAQQKADSDAHIKMLIAQHDATLQAQQQAFEQRMAEQQLANEARFEQMRLEIQRTAAANRPGPAE
jgi:hypothetical protein